MKHEVLDKIGMPYKIGEDVIIKDPEHSQYNRIGQIHKLRNYDNNPQVSVIFECGNVYKCEAKYIKYA